MIDISLICAAGDRAAAESIALRLDREAEARVWIEELPAGETVIDLWDRGSTSPGLLLILSPESVPARSGRDVWADLLKHVESGDAPSVATVLLGACPFPPILRRRNAFSLSEESMRSLVRWAVALHGLEETSFAPHPVPGNNALLAQNLMFRGPAGSAAAQAWVTATQADFRQVLWVLCADRSDAEIASEIALGFGLPLDRVDFPAIERVLENHRVLLVLDDVRVRIPVVSRGRGSVAVTTNDAGIAAAGDVIDAEEKEAAIEEPESEGAVLLWRAMSVCRPQRVPFRLASRIAGIKSCEELVQLGIAAPIDKRREWYRLRLRAPLNAPLRQKHAEALRDIFNGWTKDPALCSLLVQEIDPAYSWAREHDWVVARSLGEAAFRFLHSQHRNAEVAHLLEKIAEDARALGDEQVVKWCANELSWLGRFPLAPQSARPGVQLGFQFTS